MKKEKGKEKGHLKAEKKKKGMFKKEELRHFLVGRIGLVEELS